MRPTLRAIGLAMLASLVVVIPTSAEDGKTDFEGSVELLYRDLTQNGSPNKYNEDFDGLESGLRLSNLNARWFSFDSKLLDFLTIEASGVGGDPYERNSLRMGRKDVYDLSIKYARQDYLYNLLNVVDDQDASRWDSERTKTDIDLRFFVADQAELFVEIQDVRREGSSLFMKQVNTDQFLLDTPLDQEVQRYTVGGKFRLGSVDVVLRQQLRQYDYEFNNTTKNNPGLATGDLATLDSYAWMQKDTGDADLTTLTVHAPLGDRVDLTATLFGTLLGEEEISSQVSLDASGTSSQGICAVSGAICSASQPCNTGIPGNLCVADPYSVTGGTSTGEIDADHLMLDTDLSVMINDELDFHAQFRRVDREVNGVHLRDLDGNSVPDDTEGAAGSSTPGSTTRVDTTLSTLTGLFDYAPTSRVRLKLGYRTISRELERSGFEFGSNEYRNTNYESKNDGTLLFGVVLDPVDWFRLHADYEQGDIDQAFTAVAPMETDRLKVRARFQPRPEMRIDLSLLDYENTNDGFDFRASGNCSAAGADIDQGCYSTAIDGTSLAASFWHKPNKSVDYYVRWFQRDTTSRVRSRFDITNIVFNSAENGDAIYDNQSSGWSAQVNWTFAKSWRAFVRGLSNESDGSDNTLGETFTLFLPIDQSYVDLEGGLTYSFDNGVWVGVRYRDFDYDDGDDRRDYDGDIISVLAGMTF